MQPSGPRSAACCRIWRSCIANTSPLVASKKQEERIWMRSETEAKNEIQRKTLMSLQRISSDYLSTAIAYMSPFGIKRFPTIQPRTKSTLVYKTKSIS